MYANCKATEMLPVISLWHHHANVDKLSLIELMMTSPETEAFEVIRNANRVAPRNQRGRTVIPDCAGSSCSRPG